MWAPWLVTTLAMVVSGVIVVVVSGMWTGLADAANPEQVGQKVGEALLPGLVIVGLVAYFVQESRIREHLQRARRREHLRDAENSPGGK